MRCLIKTYVPWWSILTIVCAHILCLLYGNCQLSAYHSVNLHVPTFHARDSLAMKANWIVLWAAFTNNFFLELHLKLHCTWFNVMSWDLEPNSPFPYNKRIHNNVCVHLNIGVWDLLVSCVIQPVIQTQYGRGEGLTLCSTSLFAVLQVLHTMH